MNGLFIFLFIVFFVFPAITRALGGANKTSKSNKRPKTINFPNAQAELKARIQSLGQNRGQQNQSPSPWGDTYTGKDQDDNQANNEEWDAAQTWAQDRKRAKRRPLSKLNIASGRNSKAMHKVSNKSRSDWGVRGDHGLTSSKSIITILLLIVLVYLVNSAFFAAGE